MKKARDSSIKTLADALDGAVPGARGQRNLRIVGMGASAGGLEAFEQFFEHLPPDTGMAFVLVQHLEPTHKGMMAEILGRHTKLPVVQAEEGMRVQPNCAYVIPPNAELSILHGKLQVLEPTLPRGQRMPIDSFFRHLAADQKDQAIGIILSGMGSDGTLGLKAIKENGGMVMAQDPATAKYDSMPRSAVNTGLVDYVAAAQDLPAKLIHVVAHLQKTGLAGPQALDPDEGTSTSALEGVFVILRAHTGNDFSCYKNSTVSRRLERRMAVHQFDRLPQYVRFLQENPQEIELLHKELLIGVTSFFRDPGLFDLLKEKAIPRMLREHPPGVPIRVWNPGCSTGEESYSLCIAFQECCEALRLRGGGPAIQVFATDLDKDAIDKARRGIFGEGIRADVSPERLARFFVHDGETYRIQKQIRDLVVFAPQNLLVDPPFTKVDIICCRNLLIYFKAEAQKRVVPLMHYALNSGGLLILGTAETIGGFDPLFSALDKKWKVFQRREVADQPRLEMPLTIPPRQGVGATGRQQPRAPDMDMTYAAQRALLDDYGPPAVVVNSDGDIIYLNGRTGKYLEPASGKVNHNIFAMAREGLREELGLALHNATRQMSAVTSRGIRVKSNGGFTTVNLTVKPLAVPATQRSTFLVVFEETPAMQKETASAQVPAPSAMEPSELEDELRRTRQRLQAATEEMEATQEELRSANEELQSNNEELQSTNEELNSSKEELQSINEEMQTVNVELQSKIEELSGANNDMKNLLNGMDVATIFLNANLSIKRFTAQSARIVNLVPGDLGRPISDFATKLKYDGLIEDARDVLGTLVPKERQVEAVDGCWYHLRVLPYRTTDNVIDGVVMTFSDISPMKQLEQSLQLQKAEAQAARDYAESIVATIREPLVVLDGELRIVSASRCFHEIFQVEPAKIQGQRFYEISQRQWDIPTLRQLLEDILPQKTQFEDFRVEHDFPGCGHKILLLNARRIVSDGDKRSLILLAMEDITGSSRKQ